MENKPGLTVKKTKKPTMWEGVIEKSIIMLNDTHNQKRIQQFIVDPVLNHVMNRVYPYILLICVLFTLLLVVAMLTFAIVFLQMRQSVPGISAVSINSILPVQE
jgi:fatty-acid desaturase